MSDRQGIDGRRRVLLQGAMVVPVLLAAGAAPAADWKPAGPVEFIVGSAPASSQDRAARVLQGIIQDNKLTNVPIVVVNKPGAGGTVGLSYMNQRPNNGQFLSFTSPNIVSNFILGQTDLKHTDFTPIAVLYLSYEVFAVQTDSPLKTGAELAGKVKADPTSVSFAFGTSRGNAQHVGIALLAKAVGAEPAKLRTPVFDSSSKATMSVLGGHADVAVSIPPTFLPQVESKQVRILGVAAPQRLAPPFADIPTWKEQGFDFVATHWNGIVGPKGMTPEQIAYWDGVLKKASETPAWKSFVKESLLEDRFLLSQEAAPFLDTEFEQYRTVLTALGMAK